LHFAPPLVKALPFDHICNYKAKHIGYKNLMFIASFVISLITNLGKTYGIKVGCPQALSQEW
jgi:hypothetical protein